ncbi:MAG: glycosyltransferase, partial [Anaerolineae bacterium]|nr:glycosyltransferase [Anaerolineae bacterium]
MVKSQSLPSISIVVPSFNQAQFLDENLASIFSQDYPRLEVIVIDGGSTDHSLEIIKQWAPRLAYWQSQPDNGQSDAINQGMKRCTSDLIAWLNSDDFYWKDSLWAVG